jgi:hypothetical protein
VKQGVQLILLESKYMAGFCAGAGEEYEILPGQFQRRNPTAPPTYASQFAPD